MRDIKSKVLRKDVVLVAFREEEKSITTLIRHQSEKELQFVVSILDEVGMEDWIQDAASHDEVAIRHSQWWISTVRYPASLLFHRP